MLSFLKKTDPNERLAAEMTEHDLPAFPQILWRVLELLRDPDSKLSSIGEIIALDPGLTVKLLRMVNSAAFGLRQAVNTPGHAVALLGRHHVECLVLSLATQRALPDTSAAGFKPETFWRSAATRATVARYLSDQVCPSESAFNFTAALLQNMAIPLLAHHGPGEYGEALEQAASGNENLDTLELQRFGWTHAKVGALMGAHWRFPDDLTGSITDHHAEVDATVLATAPARLVSQLENLDNSDEFDGLVEKMERLFNVPADETTSAFEEAKAEADDLARILLA